MRRNERGAIALETVLILPVLLLIIFFMIQLIFVLLAKEMTYYAAYCGARAAMVYNPSDYNTGDGGVVKSAACTVLSWISQSMEGSNPMRIPAGNDYYEIPGSHNIWNQVSVTISEGLRTGTSGAAQNKEEFPLVTVTVNFKCPLLIPLGGRIVAGFARGPQRDTQPRDTVSELGDVVRRGAETEDSRGWAYNYIDIEETCSLGKPYNTITFPRIHDDDRSLLMMTGGAG